MTEPWQIDDGDQAYRTELADLARIPGARKALEGLLWVLSRNPELFPVLTGYEPIRLAKSKSSSEFPPEIPALNLYYRIEGRTVRLLSVLPADQEANPWRPLE